MKRIPLKSFYNFLQIENLFDALCKKDAILSFDLLEEDKFNIIFHESQLCCEIIKNTLIINFDPLRLNEEILDVFIKHDLQIHPNETYETIRELMFFMSHEAEGNSFIIFIDVAYLKQELKQSYAKLN